MSSFPIPPFVHVFVLGGFNGVFINVVADMISGPGAVMQPFALGTGLVFLIAGFVSVMLLFLVNMVLSSIFPSTSIFKHTDITAKGFLKKGLIPLLVGSITNGLVFYLVAGMQVMQGAGWLGTILSGWVALFAYNYLKSVFDYVFSA